eukprot:5687092-Amphidinium_carterae.4
MLCRLEWSIKYEGDFVDQVGRRLRIDRHSPKYLGSLAHEAASAWSIRHQQPVRGYLEGDIWWKPVHAAFRKLSAAPLA